MKKAVAVTVAQVQNSRSARSSTRQRRLRNRRQRRVPLLCSAGTTSRIGSDILLSRTSACSSIRSTVRAIWAVLWEWG